ncbi:hypothetical protein H696_03782 [Fonticula alba]|uniref:Uncharacterized protein n=1 Tax=Fonticula alba TaxID=691883 RepID=A0A058Z503_FONAL|nr:hypothetical protein H696_03782 [Fonticula alba]KCV69350.1 hypothetical protein H696_03782 [Fonticula alba]|eukprot:XP_009495915.1 hypothetical protein H696_03782 [Fonticula alba]
MLPAMSSSAAAVTTQATRVGGEQPPSAPTTNVDPINTSTSSTASDGELYVSIARVLARHLSPDLKPVTFNHHQSFYDTMVAHRGVIAAVVVTLMAKLISLGGLADSWRDPSDLVAFIMNERAPSAVTSFSINGDMPGSPDALPGTSNYISPPRHDLPWISHLRQRLIHTFYFVTLNYGSSLRDHGVLTAARLWRDELQSSESASGPSPGALHTDPFMGRTFCNILIANDFFEHISHLRHLALRQMAFNEYRLSLADGYNTGGFLSSLSGLESRLMGETALGSVLMKNIHVREVLLTFMKLLTRLRAIEQDRAAAGSTSPQGVDSSDEHAFLLMLLMRESVEASDHLPPALLGAICDHLRPFTVVPRPASTVALGLIRMCRRRLAKPLLWRAAEFLERHPELLPASRTSRSVHVLTAPGSASAHVLRFYLAARQIPFDPEPRLYFLYLCFRTILGVETCPRLDRYSPAHVNAYFSAATQIVATFAPPSASAAGSGVGSGTPGSPTSGRGARSHAAPEYNGEKITRLFDVLYQKILATRPALVPGETEDDYADIDLDSLLSCFSDYHTLELHEVEPGAFTPIGGKPGFGPASVPSPSAEGSQMATSGAYSALERILERHLPDAAAANATSLQSTAKPSAANAAGASSAGASSGTPATGGTTGGASNSTAPGEAPARSVFRVRVAIAGGDSMVQAVLLAYARLHVARPDLLARVAPVFYIVPIGRSLKFAHAISLYDPFYGRYLLHPLRSALSVLPAVDDPEVCSRHGRSDLIGDLDAVLSLRSLNAVTDMGGYFDASRNAVMSPIAYTRSLLDQHFRTATSTMHWKVFQVQYWQKARDSKEDFSGGVVIPFMGSVEVGSHVSTAVAFASEVTSSLGMPGSDPGAFAGGDGSLAGAERPAQTTSPAVLGQLTTAFGAFVTTNFTQPAASLCAGGLSVSRLRRARISSATGAGATSALSATGAGAGAGAGAGSGAGSGSGSSSGSGPSASVIRQLKHTAPELAISYTDLSVGGGFGMRRTLPSRSYHSVQVSSLPRTADHGHLVHPFSDCVELYMFEADPSRRSRNKVTQATALAVSQLQPAPAPLAFPQLLDLSSSQAVVLDSNLLSSPAGVPVGPGAAALPASGQSADSGTPGGGTSPLPRDLADSLAPVVGASLRQSTAGWLTDQAEEGHSFHVSNATVETANGRPFDLVVDGRLIEGVFAFRILPMRLSAQSADGSGGSHITFPVQATVSMDSLF